MGLIDRAAMEAHYAMLTDEALREAINAGPDTFSSTEAWAVVIAEWNRRGAPSVQASLEAAKASEDRCHLCGSTGDLFATPFGLARVVDVEAPRSPDYAAIGLSLLSVAAGGGALWPFALRRLVGGREGRSRLEVLAMELLLCESCEEQRGGKLLSDDYARHPQWGAAQHWGFDVLLNAQELESLPDADATSDNARDDGPGDSHSVG